MAVPEPRFTIRRRVGVLLAAALCTLGACSSRVLVIETEPPGAQVFMDNRELGRTPLETPFTYGGLREFLILHDEGVETSEGTVTYRPLRVRQEVENFAFDVFPFDVFTVLSPIAAEDRQVLRFRLEPEDAPARFAAAPRSYGEALEERAESLRKRAREALESGFPALPPIGAEPEAPPPAP